MRTKYHASFFTSNPLTGSIANNIANIFISLQQKGINLIPNPAQEIIAPNTSPIIRPRFVSEDGSLELAILGSRINIIQQSPTLINAKGIGSVNDFFDFARKCIESIENQNNLYASRVAFIAHDTETIEAADSSPDNFLNLTDFYRKNPPFEWGTKVNAHTELAFGNHREEVNTMLRVERAIGKSMNIETGSWEDFDRLFKEIEINTELNKTDNRFTTDDFLKFLFAANSTMSAIDLGVVPRLRF